MSNQAQLLLARHKAFLFQPQVIDDLKAITKGTQASAEQFMTGVIAAIIDAPKILELSPGTVYKAAKKVASSGLSLNPAHQEANFSLYKEKLTTNFSYQGLLKMVRRSGIVSSFEAHVVYENDDLDIALGTEGYIKHRPQILKDRGRPIAAYAVAVLKDGEKQKDFMTWQEILQVREIAPGYKFASDKNQSIWVKHPAAMAKKTVAKRLCSYLPKSHDLQEALGSEEDYSLEDTTIETQAIVPTPAAPEPLPSVVKARSKKEPKKEAPIQQPQPQTEPEYDYSDSHISNDADIGDTDSDIYGDQIQGRSEEQKPAVKTLDDELDELDGLTDF